MGELGALRPAGRAGGVKDHRGILTVPVRGLVVRGGGSQEIAEAGRIDDDRLCVRVLGAAARFVRELVPGEDQPGPGVAEVIGDLSPLEQRVHRDNHTARAEHAIVLTANSVTLGCMIPTRSPGLKPRWRSIPATRALASSSIAAHGLPSFAPSRSRDA